MECLRRLRAGASPAGRTILPPTFFLSHVISPSLHPLMILPLSSPRCRGCATRRIARPWWSCPPLSSSRSSSRTEEGKEAERESVAAVRTTLHRCYRRSPRRWPPPTFARGSHASHLQPVRATARCSWRVLQSDNHRISCRRPPCKVPVAGE